jgi:hypothetical protein
MKYCTLFVAEILFILSALVHASQPPPESKVATANNCETATSTPYETAHRFRADVIICRNSQVAWIAVARSAEDKVVVTESQHFAIDFDRVRYGFGAEEIVGDTPDKFHVQFTYGSAGTPTSDIYRFILKNGKWRVSGRDYHTLTECGDGSIGDGSRYSFNYLTGKIIITTYSQCRPTKSKERTIKAQDVELREFDPFDPKLSPEAYGIKLQE